MGADPSLGGAMVEALNGVKSGEGCQLPSQIGGLGERRELPQWDPRKSPGCKRIFCICLATERFCYERKL